MDERDEQEAFHFAFTIERRELDEVLLYALEHELMEQLPAVRRRYLHHGSLLLVVALLLGITLFVLRPESFIFSFATALAMLAGIFAYSYLCLACRGKLLLRMWMKQNRRVRDEDTLAYVLQPCETDLTREGIKVRHPDGRHEYAWRAVRSIEPTALSIAIRFRNNTVYTIPKRLFDDDASRDHFLETVRAWHAQALNPNPTP
ncbi:MAG: YcxB family protein [Phycisphaerales bacterium]